MSSTQPQMERPSPPTEGLTATLVVQALQVRYATLPADVRRVAVDCLTDWLGCTLAGAAEPASRLLEASLREEGGHAQATLVGAGAQLSVAQAALANGTASHALDYDDVNLALPGHVSVAVLPGLLALAEHRGASATDLIAAFVAGYETACRIGELVAPAHYANGFHATATIGSLGAAVACAHLLGLSPSQTCHALGVAATQAAGLKAMFGSMAKPLHAGQAAQAGVRAALLAQRGFISRDDALECLQGFAPVHGVDFHVEQALASPAGGYHLLNNLFKFHAACFSTHSTIEAVNALRRQHGVAACDIASIHVVASEACAICNIQHPATALEAKFSLRATAAFAMQALDTALLETWERVTDEGVRALIGRVQVDLVPGKSLSESVVTLQTVDGRSLRAEVQAGIPLADKADQSRRVADKFRALASPVVGADGCAHLLQQIENLEHGGSVVDLMRDCVAP